MAAPYCEMKNGLVETDVADRDRMRSGPSCSVYSENYNKILTKGNREKTSLWTSLQIDLNEYTFNEPDVLLNSRLEN
jgi:hypothetical protein